MTPPLPTDNAFNSQGKPSFAHRAANLGLLAPVFPILIGVLAHFTIRGNAALKPVFFVIGFADILLIAIGLILAILALCGIREHGPEGLLGKGIVGVVINGLLMLAITAAFVYGVQQSVKSQQARREILKANADLQSDLRKSFNPKTGITNNQSEKVEAFRARLRSAASNLIGDEAIEAEASALHIERLQSASDEYQKVLNELLASHILDVSDVTAKEELQNRRELAQRFGDANQRFTGVITNLESAFISDLKRLHASKTGQEKILAAFQRTLRPRVALLLKIRKCDDRLASSMAGAMDLLENDWGRWSISKTSGKVLFSDDATLQSYNALMLEIKAASREQVTAQRTLVNLR